MKTPELDRIHLGDTLATMRTWPDAFVHCAVTSPPYWNLRDYSVKGQLGLEKTPEEYVARMVDVFREVKRVLRDDGTLWLNVGDSYNAAGRTGHGTRDGCKQGTNRASAGGQDQVRPSAANLKPKDLVGIPWMLAFALRADGWYLRQDIIWKKSNPMPESVTDRCTKSHEYIFMLSKSERYFYDSEAIKEKGVSYDDHTTTRQERAREENKSNPTDRVNGIRADKQRGHGRRHDGFNDRWDAMGREDQTNCMRNKRDVWTVPTMPYSEAHFATFPEKLVEPCILAGTSAHGVCSGCGAPWKRETEKIAGYSKECPKTQAAHEARGGVGNPVGTVGKSGSGIIDPVVRTVGWSPTCACTGGGLSCAVVLDPFMGAGTTALVAAKLNRRFIGCELNPEYLKMADARVAHERAQIKFL
jgi:DNA modification methylase